MSFFNLFFDDSKTCDELEAIETSRSSFHHSTLEDEYPPVSKEEVYASNIANKKQHNLDENVDSKRWYHNGKYNQKKVFKDLDLKMNRDADPVSIGEFLSVIKINNVDILDIKDFAPEDCLDDIASLENIFNFENSVLSSFFDKEGFFFYDNNLYNNYPIQKVSDNSEIIKQNLKLNEKSDLPSILLATINLVSESDYIQSKKILSSWFSNHDVFELKNQEYLEFYNKIMNFSEGSRDLNSIFLKIHKNYSSKCPYLGNSIYGYQIVDFDSFMNTNFKEIYKLFKEIILEENFQFHQNFQKQFFNYIVFHNQEKFNKHLFLYSNHSVIPEFYRKNNGILYLPISDFRKHDDFFDVINSISMTWGLKLATRNDSLVEVVFHYLNVKKHHNQMRFHRDSLLII